MSETTSLNKYISQKQSELWDAYLAQIKPMREENDEMLAKLTDDYNNSIIDFTNDYNLAIKPEYEAAQKVVNPKVKQMEKKLSKIKERATKQTNAILQEFAKWRDKILAELEPQIADRLAKHKADIKPYEDYYNAKCKEVQNAFEATTKPHYELYISEASKIDEEFKRLAAQQSTFDKEKYNILTDQVTTTTISNAN